MTNQRINDVDTITTISSTDRILVNTDTVNNILKQIKKNNFITDIVSTDANNLIEVGTDNKLFSELPSEAIFGDTIYGGTIVTDLNTINKNGFYTCYGTATDVPSSSYSWFVIHQNSNVGTASATQRAVAYNSTPIIYERVKTSSTWGTWVLQGSGSGGGVVEFDNKGTVTTDITLVENKITTGYWSGTNTITLPTITDTTKQVTCILDFTTATSGYPIVNQYKALTGTFAVTNGDATVTGTDSALTTEIKANDKILISGVEYTVSSVTSVSELELTSTYAGTNASGLTLSRKIVKWSDKNGGLAPGAYMTASGVQNLLIFKSIWVDSTLYWEAEYSSYGGVETAFVQPTLSANGTLGGASFAVAANIEYSTYYAYQACDNNNGTFWNTNVSTGIFTFYNPNPLKIQSISFLNSTSGAPNGGTVYGSNDGVTWTQLSVFTNSNSTNGATWSIIVNSLNFYKYTRINFSGVLSTSLTAPQMTLNGVYIST